MMKESSAHRTVIPTHVRARLEFIGRIVMLIAVGASIAGALAYCYYQMFVVFQFYDDEGNNMMAQKAFNEGRALYGETQAGYGPFLYLYHRIIYLLLNSPVSHDLTRLITLAHWIGAASICGAFVIRLTRSWVLGTVVFLESALYLSALKNEPGSAQSLQMPILMTILLASTYLRPDSKFQISALVIGVLSALVVMVKINVGVFLCVALVMLVLYSLPRSGVYRIGYVIAILGAASLPALVIGTELETLHKLVYPIIISLGTISIGLAGYRRRDIEALPPAIAGWSIASFILAIFLIIAVTMWTGTTLQDLVQGMWTRPRARAESWPLPLGMPNGSLKYAWIATILAMPLLFLRKPHRISNRIYLAVLTCLKVGVAYQILRVGAQIGGEVPARHQFIECAPWLWLLVIQSSPSRSLSLSQLIPRYLLACLATLEILQVFPVAGTQPYVATVFMIPAAAILLWDAISPVFARASEIISTNRFVVLRPWVAAVLIALLGELFTHTASFEHVKAKYKSATPLALPGATHIRLTPGLVATYTWLANNLRASSTFTSLPALGSLHFFAEVDSPADFNIIGPSILFLSDQEQNATIDALERSPRPYFCLFRQGVRFWRIGRLFAEEPLAQHLLTRYFKFAEAGSYQLFAHKKVPRNTVHEYLQFGTKQYDGVSEYLRLPRDRFASTEGLTLLLSFKTVGTGVLVGMQTQGLRGAKSEAGVPAAYVGVDGRLYCQWFTGRIEPMISMRPVNDDKWHHLVITANSNKQWGYLDGVMLGSVKGQRRIGRYRIAQLGAGLAPGWPASKTRDPLFFQGTLKDVIVAPRHMPPRLVEAAYLKAASDFAM